MSATDTRPVNTTARSFGTSALALMFVVGMLFGGATSITSRILLAPPPQALVAQVGTGTFLTAPTCTTGDQIYQVAINAGEAMQVTNGKLATGDLVITATAKFAESGTAEVVVVEAKARDAKAPQPVLASAYAWKAPVNAAPGSQATYEVVRYAIPPKAGKAELLPTKVAFSKATTVYVCASNQPR